MLRAGAYALFVLAVLVLGLSLGLGAAPTSGIPAMSVGNADALSASDASIPEFVAQQIRSGNLTCPADEPLTYEACLLYQGALGAWMTAGMPDECPAVIGESQAPAAQGNGKIAHSEGDHAASEVDSRKPFARFTAGDASRARNSPCFGYLYAIGVANTVPILASTSNRAFRMISGIKFDDPGSDANLCLIARNGICGNQAALGISLFQKAGLEARPLEFYYSIEGKRRSHVIVEAFIDNDWRPIDTTYGAYWIDPTPGKPFALISTETLVEGTPGRALVKWNDALSPYGFFAAISRQDVFSYLTSDPDIIRGGRGEVRIEIAGDAGSERLRDKPSFIGYHDNELQRQGISYLFVGKNDGHLTVEVTVAGFEFSGGSPEICIDQQCQPLSAEQKTYKFRALEPKRLHLQASGDLAYVVLASVAWSREPRP